MIPIITKIVDYISYCYGIKTIWTIFKTMQDFDKSPVFAWTLHFKILFDIFDTNFSFT